MLYQPRDPNNDVYIVSIYMDEPTFNPSLEEGFDLLILALTHSIGLLKEIKELKALKEHQ